MSEIGQLLASMWSLFQQVDVPVLGIKFSTFYLGVFAVEFSILILGPILGIGRGISHNRINVKNNWRKRSKEDEED